MSRRLAVAALALTFAAACASQKPATSRPVPAPERQRITNQPYFDLATCHPASLTMPEPPNESALVGALVAASPSILECLVSPASRGGSEDTKVVVETTVTPEKATQAVSGENVTDEGKQCVQKIVDERATARPVAAGAEPVKARAEFQHKSGVTPSVGMGMNEGSDFSAAIRLAQPTWCDCYADFKDRPAPLLTATVKLVKAQVTPAEVTFQPAGSAEGEALAACLAKKIQALPVKLSVDELSFPYRFVHFHSRASELPEGLPADLRFFQLELMRSQRAADAAVALGTRANAATAYDASVAQYKKNPSSVPVKRLKEQCGALVTAASKWLAALQAQQKLDEQTLAVVQELKDQDTRWSEAEAAAQGALERTRKEVALATQRRGEDQQACPKERY